MTISLTGVCFLIAVICFVLVLLNLHLSFSLEVVGFIFIALGLFFGSPGAPASRA